MSMRKRVCGRCTVYMPCSCHAFFSTIFVNTITQMTRFGTYSKKKPYLHSKNNFSECNQKKTFYVHTRKTLKNHMVGCVLVVCWLCKMFCVCSVWVCVLIGGMEVGWEKSPPHIIAHTTRVEHAQVEHFLCFFCFSVRLSTWNLC